MWSILTHRTTTNVLYWWTSPSILQLKYLFINAYKEAPNCRFYYMFVLFVKIQFLIWIWDSKPAGTKSGYANHWATLHWLVLFSLFWADVYLLQWLSPGVGHLGVNVKAIVITAKSFMCWGKRLMFKFK